MGFKPPGDGGDSPGGLVSVPASRFPLGGVGLTARGYVGAAIMALVWYGSVVVESNLLLLLSGMFVGLLVISVWLSRGAVGGMSVARVVGGPVVAGQRFTVRYRLHNPRRRCVRSVWIGELGGEGRRVRVGEAYVPMIEPRSTVVIEQEGLALRRGLAHLDRVRLWSRFPFGLVRSRREVSVPGRLTVLPRLYAIRGDLWGARDGSVGASSDLVRRGSGVDDFLGLREYRPGDSLRWIHWRRSVRTGQLVVRQMYPYTSAACTIVVDHRAADRSPGAELRREQVVSAAASLACQALERGLRVGLIALARCSAAIPPVSGRDHRTRIVTELASLEGEPAGGLRETMEGLRRGSLQGSRWVLFTSLTDGQVQGLDSFLGGAGLEVRTFRPGTEVFEAVFGPPAPGGAVSESPPNPGIEHGLPKKAGGGEGPVGAAPGTGAGGER